MPEAPDNVQSTEHDPAPVCAACGCRPGGHEAEAGVLLTWSRAIEAGQVVWFCGACSRQHLRSIEGKLDSAWW
ncbi:MAG: hypothetical protein ACK5MP_07285 [Nostocoides sp.]